MRLGRRCHCNTQTFGRVVTFQGGWLWKRGTLAQAGSRGGLIITHVTFSPKLVFCQFFSLLSKKAVS